MSKEGHLNDKKIVETVDNSINEFNKIIYEYSNVDRLKLIQEMIEHSITTLEFWHCYETWPTNIVHDSLDYALKIVGFMLMTIKTENSKPSKK